MSDEQLPGEHVDPVLQESNSAVEPAVAETRLPVRLVERGSVAMPQPALS